MRFLLMGVLFFGVACTQKSAPHYAKAADRTFVFTDYEVPLKRMLDVGLGVVCYVSGAQLSCVSIAPSGSLGDDKL